MKSAHAIAFDYTASRGVAGASFALSLGAAAAPWLSDLPVAACAVLSLAAVTVGATSARRFLRPRVRRVALRESGWTLVDAAGVEHPAALAAHARLGGWLSLDFRTRHRRRWRLLIGPDNAPAETRRRLTVLLLRAEIARPD